jgi:hypothetical protein
MLEELLAEISSALKVEYRFRVVTRGYRTGEIPHPGPPPWPRVELVDAISSSPRIAFSVRTTRFALVEHFC